MATAMPDGADTNASASTVAPAATDGVRTSGDTTSAPSTSARAPSGATAAAAARAAVTMMRKRAALDDLLASSVRLTKRGRPTDRAVPAHVRAAVPSSPLYTHLRLMERQLDWAVARRRSELVEALQHAPQSRRKLRVFVSHSCADQAWQTLAQSTSSSSGSPSFTLRIEGRLLDPTVRSRSNQAEGARATAARIGAYKFSNLVRRVLVSFELETGAPAHAIPLAEWHQPTPIPVPLGQNTGALSGPTAQAGATSGLEPGQLASTAAPVDGFEVKRLSSRTVRAKILLYPAANPEKFRVAEPLASLVQLTVGTRGEVVSALWQYVCAQGLLHPTDRQMVMCDTVLRQLLQAPTVNYHHIPEMINRFLLPPEPIAIDHLVRTDADQRNHTLAYDLDVDLDDFGHKLRGHEILARFDAQAHVPGEVVDLDERIAEAAAAARNHAAVRDFFHAFARQPREHIHSWISTHAKDLAAAAAKPVLGGKGTTNAVGNEEVRRAETFRGPWVEESLVVAESHRNAARFKNLQAAPTEQDQAHTPGSSHTGAAHRHQLRSYNR